MSQREVEYFVVFSVEVLAAGHASQYAFGVCGFVEWHCDPVRVIVARSEVSSRKFYRVELTEPTKCKWLDSAL